MVVVYVFMTVTGGSIVPGDRGGEAMSITGERDGEVVSINGD